jgi:thiol:disulfide interchange protein
MQRATLALIIGCLLFSFSACTRNAPTEQANTATNATPTPTAKATPKQIVQASAEPVTLKQGGTAEAQVRLQIAAGYHVNANPASFSYLKATEVEVGPAGGVAVKKPVYPVAVMKKFQFAPQPIAVYEHEAVIKLPLGAKGVTSPGAQTLPVRVHVQACDEETCYPPTTVETQIPVTIN